MSYILEHINEFSDRRYLGTFDTRKVAIAAMVADITSYQREPYYYRTWMVNDNTERIDYGSHSRFYEITEIKDGD